MKNNFKKNKKGLTLIEMLVAIAILGLTLVASTAVAGAYLRYNKIVRSYQTANEELSIALNAISKDIRMTNCQDRTDGLSCSTWLNGTPVNPSNRYQNEITVIDNANDAEITYTFENGTQTLLHNGSDILENVTGMFYIHSHTGSFNDNEIKRVTIQLTRKGTASGAPDVTAQTTVSMRNRYLDEN